MLGPDIVGATSFAVPAGLSSSDPWKRRDTGNEVGGLPVGSYFSFLPWEALSYDRT